MTSASGRAYVAYATAPAQELALDRPRSFVEVAARDASGAWNMPRRVSGSPAAEPALTVAPDGAVVAAWRETSFDTIDMPRYGSVGAAIGSPGGTFAPPRHVADARTVGVLLGAGRTGSTVLAWASGSLDVPGPLDVAARAPHAARFGPVRRAPGTSVRVRQSALAVLDDGTALFAGPDGARDGIRLAIRPRGGRFGRARLIARHGFAPQIAVAGRSATIVYSVGNAGEARYVTVTRR